MEGIVIYGREDCTEKLKYTGLALKKMCSISFYGFISNARRVFQFFLILTILASHNNGKMFTSNPFKLRQVDPQGSLYLCANSDSGNVASSLACLSLGSQLHSVYPWETFPGFSLNPPFHLACLLCCVGSKSPRAQWRCHTRGRCPVRPRRRRVPGSLPSSGTRHSCPLADPSHVLSWGRGDYFESC